MSATRVSPPTTITARFDVHTDLDIESPQFETTGPFTPSGQDEPMYATTGIDDDLMEATKIAVLSMVDHLHEHYDLTREEAYVLCSVTVDLKINEIVDEPNWWCRRIWPDSCFRTSETR